MTRRERERAILSKVTAKVNEIAPKGLGHWDPAIEIVRDPSDRFLDALDAWLDHDTPDTRRALQEKADAFVGAWAEAGRRFLEEGRPDSRQEVPA